MEKQMEEILATQDNEEVQSPSMDETIASEWAKIQGKQGRDDQGKFASEEKEGVAEIPQTEVKAEVVAEIPLNAEEVQAVKPPSSWKKEAQAKFATLPPDIQAEVMRREADMHKGLDQYKQNAERAQAYDKVFQPYMPTIQKLGLTPEVAVSELMKTDHNLRYGTPAQKVAIVQDILKQYQIDPSWFDQIPNNSVDPQIGQLQSQFQTLQAQQAEWQKQQKEMIESQQTEVLNSTISEFAKSHEHFDLVRDQMADLIQGAGASGRNLSMNEAYEQAIWANPTVRATLLAKQQAEARATAQAKAEAAKKAAAVNVRTRGTLPAQKAATSIDETIRAKAQELGMI
jgi:hypothetical protein